MIAPTPILRAPIYDIHDAHLQQTLAESRQLCATPASTEPNDAQVAEAEASGGAPPSFRRLRIRLAALSDAELWPSREPPGLPRERGAGVAGQLGGRGSGQFG